MPVKLLIPREQYLASGIHIGMKQRTADMKNFIYKIRDDGLSVLNLKIVDERIHIAAKLLAKCQRILVVGRKAVVHDTVKKFVEVVGGQAVIGRFMPGTLTNPQYKRFYEADVIIITDPMVDYQALQEAVNARIPIVAICDTFNETRNIDLIIPANNKGKKALGMLFWLMARQILKERGTISSDSEFTHKLEDFAKE
jgi:small subunit ribosomal protein S2